MNVLVDTNVLLDWLMRRGEFYTPAATIVGWAEQERIVMHIAAISLNNCAYIMESKQNRAAALQGVRTLLRMCRVVPMDAKIAEDALELDLRDFEYGIQAIAARRAACEVLVTRDRDDFATLRDLAVLSPSAFVERFEIHP